MRLCLRLYTHTLKVTCTCCCATGVDIELKDSLGRTAVDLAMLLQNRFGFSLLNTDVDDVKAALRARMPQQGDPAPAATTAKSLMELICPMAPPVDDAASDSSDMDMDMDAGASDDESDHHVYDLSASVVGILLQLRIWSLTVNAQQLLCLMPCF